MAKRLEILASGNEKKDFVWRDTLSDGFLPFANFYPKYIEKEKKKVEIQPLFDEKTECLVKTY